MEPLCARQTAIDKTGLPAPRSAWDKMQLGCYMVGKGMEKRAGKGKMTF
jgi:hypothetical protein